MCLITSETKQKSPKQRIVCNTTLSVYVYTTVVRDAYYAYSK